MARRTTLGGSDVMPTAEARSTIDSEPPGGWRRKGTTMSTSRLAACARHLDTRPKSTTGAIAALKTATTPLVTIGLAVYNGERYLREALESLVGQTLRDVEIVICDNASDDATEAICREFAERDPRVRYHRNATNIGGARNE